MDEVNVYLVGLVAQNKLSYREAEFFLDFAFDLVLDNVNDEQIKSIVTKEINKHIEKK